MSENQMSKRYLLGIFDDEDTVIHAVKSFVKEGISVTDVFTPYAVHGLDEAMGIRRSRLPYVSFIAGLIGLMLGLGFQIWVFNSSWPMNIGGKPHMAIPAFMPVGFEVTVLVCGLVTVAAFFIRSGLRPGNALKAIDHRVTDGHFVLAIETVDASLDESRIDKMLRDHGAIEVHKREVQL